MTEASEPVEEWIGWHFLPSDRKLRYGDGRSPAVGETLKCEGDLVLCQNGMHACRKAIDALGYAPGTIACLVRLSGEIVYPTGSDKACARERTVLAMADATDLLHEFACWCAETALLREREKGREPDPRAWAAIEAKRRWLKGAATDEELDAARDAARAASWAASRDAARDDAWAASWAASRAASWAAAGDDINLELERRLRALLQAEMEDA